MDIATIIGLVIATTVMVSAILMGGSPIMFVDVPSMLIVGGGTIASALIRSPLGHVLGAFKVGAKAFIGKVPEPTDVIERIVALANKARKDGILALEEEKIDDPFLEKAVGYCVDGMKEEDVKATLMNDMRSTAQRHRTGQDIMKGMGASAPAFGMIGTLIGLVQMLAAMSDPSSIGPAMALALLTTLYGAILSNVLFLPMADKLKVRSEQEQLNMMLCIEGVLGLAQGINPKSLDQQLSVFLAARSRRKPAGPEAVPSKEAAA